MSVRQTNIALVEAVASLQLLESGKGPNVKTTSLAKAKKYVQSILKKDGRSIDDVFPDFSKNYMRLKSKVGKSLGIPRIEMPVIRSFNVGDFKARLQRGELDVAKPYAKGRLSTPTNLDKSSGGQWLKLGLKDGDLKDDIVKAVASRVPVKDLLPTQSDLWFSELIGSKAEFSKFQGKPFAPIIVSKEGYILDGHHRFGRMMLISPDLRMKVLRVPLSIDLLLRVGRSYGNAMGSKQQR